MTHAPFVRAIPRDALPTDSALCVRVGRYEVALFDVAGELFAVENACPHQGGPLVDGHVEQGVVTCPWHAWRFSLRTGWMTLGDFARLTRFAVRTEEGDIWIREEPEAE